MESFKIEHFEAGGGKKFPKFKSLSPEECSVIAQNWKKVFSCEKGINSDELVKIISSSCESVVGYSVDEDGLDLALLFKELKISLPENIYLNWHHFDKIDEMRFNDFCENLDDIWYPSSDDLDVFDSSFSWVVSITHYGGINHWRVSKR